MSDYYLSRIFDFACSHFLTDYKGKCENLHGHNYKLIVTIKDTVKNDGMVIDFKDLKKIVNLKIIDKIDHTHLNDIIDNPTAENIIKWIWNQLKKEIALYSLKLYETENCFIEYRG